MKFLIIGLGSMGQRRIRCLERLGYDDIVGFDVDEEKAWQAKDEYDINIINRLDSADLSRVDAMVVSTPPDAHNEYIECAIEQEIPSFVEASVIREGLPELKERADESGVRIAPSCTMRFHPAVRDIKRIVEEGGFGHITTFSYHMGQYLPDWHPWQDVQDFYVSRPRTSGTREMIPFELTWLTDVVGLPHKVTSVAGRTANVGADIIDSYGVALEFDTAIGTMMIDVVARYAIRKLTLNLERAQIQWSWDDGDVRLYDVEEERWIEYQTPSGESEQGYNDNIIEEMYRDEIASFIADLNGEQEFPNTLADDIEILDLLHEIEDTA